jgi:hypothetical protein
MRQIPRTPTRLGGDSRVRVGPIPDQLRFCGQVRVDALVRTTRTPTGLLSCIVGPPGRFPRDLLGQSTRVHSQRDPGGLRTTVLK